MASTTTTGGRLRAIAGRASIVLLLTTLGFASSAGAAERYAEPAGDGPAATCPQSDPCSLNAAVENAAVIDGDEIIVTPGTYNIVSLSVSDDIDLHGQSNPTAPTINATGSPAVFVNDSATVRDLRIDTSGTVAVTVGFSGAGAVIERLATHATAGGGFACSVGTSATIRDSICRQSGMNSRGLGVNLSTFSGDYTVLVRNVTAVGTANGIGYDLGGAGVNFTLDVKNTIAEGGTNDVRAGADGGASTQITLENSNYATEQELATNGSTVATVTTPGTGVGNQMAAPVFAGPGDFHQDPTSPTVDAGQVDAFLGSGDFEGNGRILEGNRSCPTAPDIGADELFLPAIDCDPPETSINGGPTGATDDQTPTFDLVSDEPNSTFECRVDGAAFAPCSTPFTTAPLSDASHTVEARATDESGNVDPSPASRTFTVEAVDSDPPETTITDAPKAKVKTRKKRVRVSYSFSADEAGTFECSLDEEPFSSCSSPFTQKVGKGPHSFSVRAIDATGNVDGSSATDTFKVKRKRKGKR